MDKMNEFSLQMYFVEHDWMSNAVRCYVVKNNYLTLHTLYTKSRKL